MLMRSRADVETGENGHVYLLPLQTLHKIELFMTTHHHFVKPPLFPAMSTESRSVLVLICFIIFLLVLLLVLLLTVINSLLSNGSAAMFS